MPAVSVVIPVVNRTSAVGDALRSVFEQTFQDFEIILVGDALTDDSELSAVVSTWRGELHRIPQPDAGLTVARNAAIARARGRFIAFLDTDAEWMPEKLAGQIEYFERYTDTGLLHAAIVGETHRSTAAEGPPRHAFDDLLHASLFVNTPTVLVPRRVLDDVGGFEAYGEAQAEDWDLWLRIAARHPVGYISEPLAFCRPRPRLGDEIERYYSGQRLVIDRNRGLSERACQQHRSAAGRCRRARRYQLHRDWGYERLQAGDRTGAREQLQQAVTCAPWRLDAVLLYCSTFVSRERNGGTGDRNQPTVQPVRRAAGAPRTIPSLIHDTVYRRLRRRVISRLHDLDDGLSKAGRSRKRILFDAVSPMSFAVFRPIFERLRRDDRLELWFTASGAVWQPQEIFGTEGITQRIVPASAAGRMKVDAYINTDFWDMTWLTRRTRRVHLFHGVAGKYGLDAPTDLAPTISAFDCLMFANPDRRDRYIEAGLVPDDDVKAALVGYPKTDRLVDGSLDRRAIARALAFDPAVPSVIYAPTWSPFSSLNAMGEEIVERLTAEGLQVIVKLHDRSYDLRERGSGGIDWAARLAKYDGHPLVRVVREADGSPFMTIADVMVSDHSSIAFEYMLLDRPIVAIDRPELVARAGISADKVNRLRAAADVVSDASEMACAVVAALGRPDRLSSQRRQTAGDLFYRPGTATDRAVQLIYRLIELPALVDTSSTVESNRALAAAG